MIDRLRCPFGPSIGTIVSSQLSLLAVCLSLLILSGLIMSTIRPWSPLSLHVSGVSDVFFFFRACQRCTTISFRIALIPDQTCPPKLWSSDRHLLYISLKQIADVKAAVEKEQGASDFPKDALKLIHKGVILKDDATLESSDITESGFVVVMAMKVRPVCH